jgi:hypothetical protein
MIDGAQQLIEMQQSTIYLSEMNIKLSALMDLAEERNARLLSIDNALA